MISIYCLTQIIDFNIHKLVKILHIVGGASSSGAYKGAFTLHKALLRLDVDSNILNDSPPIKNNKKLQENNFNIHFINNNFYKKFINKVWVNFEKILKSFFLKSPRATFTLGIFGFDITKVDQYKDADIIHIHWLNQGFIKIKSLSKIDKPVVWTMRDMWPFTGGPHYTMDFKNFQESNISKILQNLKMKNYPTNTKFIAISNWLKAQAEKSKILKDKEVSTIYNNIDLDDFNVTSKSSARKLLNISTNKKIILYGANNPQNLRKGWDIFIETLKKLDKSKYFLLIFGNFWSQKILDNIRIEYKCLGFIEDKKILNAAYSSSDLFIFSSIQDAFGKTWAEALACEIPVVCFQNTCASEIIDHKTTGYIVDKLESDELKKGIDWISNELDFKSFEKNNFRKKILSFESQNIAKQYIELYKKILVKN